MRFCNKQSGVTLIELIVIIAIVAVVAGIAVPNFLSYLPKHRLNGAARQVMGDLMWARMQAVKENNEFKVFFIDEAGDFVGNGREYMILDDDDNNGDVGTGEWTTQPPKDIQREYSDVTFIATRNPIFNPRGTAPGGTTITLTNSSGTKDVSVSWAGRVRIE
jgi:type IV fimbrial biogenesis protein FimT